MPDKDADAVAGIRFEENVADFVFCGSCGSNWSKGDFAGGCPECGGYAMERPCPRCGGLCGSEWGRAADDSQYEGVAHWIGECRLAWHSDIRNWYPPPGTEFEWWLDEAALPEQRWICLVVLPSGEARLVDGDGVTRLFDAVAAAREWLREDECDTLSSLMSQGVVPRSVAPPGDMMERIARLLSRDGLLPLGQSPESR